MPAKRLGRQTVRLSNPVSVVSYASIGGKLEAQGPLAGYFDELSTDSFFGCKTWEKGEAAMQRRALERALQKGGLSPEDLDYILAGDLLNQCIGTSFSLREFRVPFYGLYGACSTMGEGLSLASLLIDGGFARLAAAQTSSHYCTAERQYRMPVPYGSPDRPVDGHRGGLLHPRCAGRRAVYHARHLWKDRRPRHQRCQQHGRGHGARRARHARRPPA